MQLFEDGMVRIGVVRAEQMHDLARNVALFQVRRRCRSQIRRDRPAASSSAYA
jgi:hypothetical protein